MSDKKTAGETRPGVCGYQDRHTGFFGSIPPTDMVVQASPSAGQEDPAILFFFPVNFSGYGTFPGAALCISRDIVAISPSVTVLPVYSSGDPLRLFQRSRGRCGGSCGS